MTRIFVVRHAEAEGNLYRRIHGHYDSAVTRNGQRQIAALARRFEGETVDICYSSDLIRTRATAQAVCGPKGLPLHLDPRFREVNLGVWEDQPFGCLGRVDPVMLARFDADPYNWHVEGAEDFEAYSGRFLTALREAARANPDRTAAVFAHGSVIRAMQLCLFYSLETIGELGHCDNTGVSLLEYEDGAFRAVYLNDNSHLSSEISTLARQNWWRKQGDRRDRNLWYRPMTPDAAWYGACRREAWEALYGPAPDFDSGAFYRGALNEAQREPEALCDVMLEDQRVGLLQLSPSVDARDGAGYIAFLYLLPAYRGQGLGVQLIGQAVSVYRRLGRSCLRLGVSPHNAPALAFYQKYGFAPSGHVPGRYGSLLRMDLDIVPEHSFRRLEAVDVS